MAEKKLCKVVRLQLSKLYDENGQERYPYGALWDIQKRVSQVKNRTIQICWEWDVRQEAYKKEHGVYPNELDLNEGVSIRTKIYRTISKEFPEMNTGNLSTNTQFAEKAFKAAKKNIHAGACSIPSYKKDGPIEIHGNSLQLKQVNNKFYVSIGIFSRQYKKEKAYQSTQVEFELYRLGGSQQAIVRRCIDETYHKTSSKLIYDKRKRCWFLNLSYEFTPVADSSLDPNKIMGVDLGVKCVAYMGFTFQQTRYCIDGGEVEHFRSKTEARKRSLQRQGKYCGQGRVNHGRETRTEPVLKIRDAIARFRDTANHKYSRFIVAKAVENHCGVIQMEDLQRIGKNRFLRDWTYFDLRQKLEYKAEEAGIQVRFVNPQYTSQRCSQCGYIDRENRPEQAVFHCLQCGYKANADYNASVNLATDGIEQIIIDSLGANSK